jgi:DNA (cytosine-5)-methyltransferase 1
MEGNVVKQLDMFSEIIVDSFCGGGGASTGIEEAIGRSVDIGINHDPAAIAMHRANHPNTEHYCESVWEVDPIKAVRGRPVALAWFSPDCKHFSKAKGGKPVEKKIRGLAWIVLRWAALVRPRVIMLENVEEFQTWGPLNRRSHPIKGKKGQTFWKWIGQLEALGYKVETKELIAADYGAPTKRKRFFMVARCDGKPIVWPNPTHGDRNSEEVKKGLLKPYVPAADIIDWDIPCKSIFDRKKPLAENTMKRIARGLQKFVIENAEPFIIPIGYGEREGQAPRVNDINDPLGTIVSSGKHYLCTPYITQIGQTGFTEDRSKSIEEPITTIVSKQEHILVAPTLIQYHSETTKGEVRGQELKEPIMTIDSNPRYGLVSAFISKYYAGESRSTASDISDSLHTVTARQGHALVTSHLIKYKGDNIGQSVNEPLQTITAGGMHFGEVRAFLIKYYGQGTGQDIKEPLDTVVGKDRFGLVTIEGQDYQIVDIGMRMLEPHELFKAQGFPEDYIIDRDDKGNPYPKKEQVARCGNAVPPPFAEALTRANLPELCDSEDTGRYYHAE